MSKQAVPKHMRSLPFLLLAVASLAVLAGALMKIQQRPGANAVMAAGMILELGCAAFFVRRSLRSR